MRNLPRAARVYVVAVVLAGVATIAWRMGTGPLLQGGPVFVILLLLAVALGSRTVALGHKAEMALSLPLILCALLAVGDGAALDVAVVGMLSTCLLRRKPFPVHRTLFNVTSIAIVTFASGRIYTELAAGDARFTPSAYILPLLVSVLTYFVTNTSLVAMVIALSNRRPFSEVWRDSFGWTLISYLAGGSIAAGMVHLLQAFGPYSLLLAAPPILLIYHFFRLYADRAAERRKRIEEIERHNARLESEVARRTQELVELNERLRQSNEELMRANRLKSEFLANMSHELRTPLNAIIGFSELLQDSNFGPLQPDQREFVQDIHSGGRHLLELINDILDLSKIEAGRMGLHREETELPEILRETLTVVRPLALKKKLHLQVAIDPAARARLGGPRQAQADHVQPPLQRREVHRGGRAGHGRRRRGGGGPGGVGAGLGHRHPGLRHRQDLRRVLPGGRVLHAPPRGDGAGPVAGQAARADARRRDRGDEPARRRKRLPLPAAGRRAPRRGGAVRRAGARRGPSSRPRPLPTGAGSS